MTPEQLAIELDKRNLAAQQLLGTSQPEQVVAGPAPSDSATSVENELVSKQKDEPRVFTQAPDVDTESGNTFLDMILRNDAVRLKEKEAFERREKSDRARTRIAALTDAIASLGNLVGTTQGAFSQPQTYQTPFVTDQVAQDRAIARQRANMLQQSQQSLRLAMAREEASNNTYALRQALEEEKTRRALAQIQGRADLAEKNAEWKSEQIAQQGEIRNQIVDKQTASAEKRTGITAGVSRANAKDRVQLGREKLEAQKNGEIGGSSGVGGYTKTETIVRDDYGNVIEKKTTRSPGGTHGSSASSSKTPPSKQNKDKKKVPPSKRK